MQIYENKKNLYFFLTSSHNFVGKSITYGIRKNECIKTLFWKEVFSHIHVKNTYPLTSMIFSFTISSILIRQWIFKNPVCHCKLFACIKQCSCSLQAIYHCLILYSCLFSSSTCIQILNLWSLCSCLFSASTTQTEESHVQWKAFS